MIRDSERASPWLPHKEGLGSPPPAPAAVLLYNTLRAPGLTLIVARSFSGQTPFLSAKDK